VKSQTLGKNIFEVEVQNISSQGIWLYVQGTEYFLSFKEYPWFKNAKVADIHSVELLGGNHICWPTLDVDIELESLEQPEKYPLVYRN